MLFILSIVIILLSTIKTGNATDLVGLPLSISSKSININATLTDNNAGSEYFIQESISASGASIRGGIVISGEDDSYNVYYNTYSDFNKDRLVIHGTNCLPFTFKSDWDQSLPGIKKPVTNLVLLMGPSILYRFDHSSLVWTSVTDKNIRGTMMKGATTDINGRLNITYYYKKHYAEHFDEDYGIKHPSRIEFSGYDPYSTSYSNNENLILDIYFQNENYYDQLANEVHPLPGMGCPHYLSTERPSIPKLKSSDYVHYTMYEYIKGSTSSRTFSEIHASEKHKLLRLKSNLLGVTTEAIYDYKIDVSYLFEEGGSCSMFPTDENSPGINSHGGFYLDSLLLVDDISFPFRYIGKLNLEHLAGFPVYAWESIRFHVYINGEKVDKAVITQYFAESHGSGIFPGYTLVSTKISIYELQSSKKTSTATLIREYSRDYMNFEKVGLEEELHDEFTLKDCKYLTSDKTLTLAFLFECKGEFCTELMETSVYHLKQSFMHFIIFTKFISILRIDNVQYNINGAQLEIEVTFLDKPNYQYVFKSKNMSVSADTFEIMQKMVANTEYECLEKLSKLQDTISVVIYKSSDSSCGYLQSSYDLKKDKKDGEPCSVYNFPLNNLRHIAQETPLDQIQNILLESLGWGVSYSSSQSIRIVNIIDKTENKITSVEGFQSKIRSDAKLNGNNKVTVTVPDVKTLADCYRNCHNSEQLKCNTFSFCSNGDCRVSSLLTEDSYNESHVEQDKRCSIYALNVINDYSEVPHRKFKTQTSIAVDKSIDSCAESCLASSNCFSFQWCDYQCSFGGVYTDEASKYSEYCSVYIPKVSDKYQKTGNKIVSDVLYTEMNLNFEQCASLCHGWSDGETGCKSFNYCPKSKTESSCSLTQFSVKGSDTETSEGGFCSNYELNLESNGRKSKESSLTEVTKGTSGSGTFGIIIMFLFVGALLGFAAPFGYIKAKRLRSTSEANESFTWKRQVDAQARNMNGTSF